MPVHSIKNKILTAFKNAIESKLPEELQQHVERIVVAGMKVLYSNSTHPMVLQVYDQIADAQFSPDAIANATAHLIGIVYKGSHGKMQKEAAIPAASILITYIIDDLETLKGMAVEKDAVRASVALLAQKLSEMLDQDAARQNGQEGQPAEDQPQPSAQQPAGAAVPQPGMAAPQGAM